MSFFRPMVYGESQLKYLLPGVQEAFAKTRADALLEGIVLEVPDFAGMRTSEIVAQLLAWRDEAVKAGEPWYRVSPFTTTKHALGGAVDFRVKSRPKTMTDAQAYARVGALARPHGLLWGGNFSAAGGAPDPFHLESQQTLEQLRPRWAAWQKDPAFPRMGAAEWSVLAVVALLALALLYFFARG